MNASIKPYSLTTSTAVKRINLKLLSPKLSLEETKQFATDFGKAMVGIQPSSFEIHIDASSFQVVSKDLVSTLEDALKVYKQTGFKKVTVNCGDSVVLGSQVLRLARSIQLNQLSTITKGVEKSAKLM
ncbi:hypothetical protein [Bacillus massiliigorillae]|uniref:hypothetical protein n=1 Tax=Bacillus massiliigorillae TaxID=1243664 RepID=UPI0003A88CC7|nr:hypothetical protein [Bacillus massiliigorillae]